MSVVPITYACKRAPYSIADKILDVIARLMLIIWMVFQIHASGLAQGITADSNPEFSFHPKPNDDDYLFSPPSNLESALLGGVLYLKEKQVGTMPYRMTPADFIERHTCNTTLLSRVRSFVGNYVVREKHLEGTWPSVVSFIPSVGPKAWQPFFMATDYNAFTTATIGQILFRINDSALPQNMKFLDEMRINSLVASDQFRNCYGYNFWLKRPLSNHNISVSSPLNIPIWMIDIRKRFSDATNIGKLPEFDESDLLDAWMDRIYNKKENAWGGTALFNVPNDSDDTSLAMILKMKFFQTYGLTLHEGDSLALFMLAKYRDTDRYEKDRHNQHLSNETHAFLTWHRHEHNPLFSEPEAGVLPLAINNIDLVVNSNILRALGMANLKHLRGFDESLSVISALAHGGLWKKCLLYYPEALWLPYSFAKAVREGNIQSEIAINTLITLMRDMLQEKRLFEIQHPDVYGAFPPSDSVSFSLSTALGLNALIYMGEEIAQEAGLVEYYRTSIDNAVAFLVKHKRNAGISKLGPQVMHTTNYWPSGPIFSSSIKQLASWYSNALTTALAVEALSHVIQNTGSSPYQAAPEALHLVLFNNQLRIKSGMPEAAQ